MATLSNPSLTATLSTDDPLTWQLLVEYDVHLTAAEAAPHAKFDDWFVIAGKKFQSTDAVPASTSPTKRKLSGKLTNVVSTPGGSRKATIHLKNEGLNLPSQHIDTPALIVGGMAS